MGAVWGPTVGRAVLRGWFFGFLVLPFVVGIDRYFPVGLAVLGKITFEMEEDAVVRRVGLWCGRLISGGIILLIQV